MGQFDFDSSGKSISSKKCLELVVLSGARVPAQPGSAQVEASRKCVSAHAAAGSSLKNIFLCNFIVLQLQ